ncbi:MAG: acetate/propionate family kinase, partial [Pseudolabrys sp.]
MNGAVLVINSGSSSIKFALYPSSGRNGELTALYDGEIEGIGDAARLRVRDADGKPLVETAIPGPATHHAALSALLEWIAGHAGGTELAAAGHRVVHGGREFTGPVRLTPDTIAKLEALNPLAPLHQPHNLAAIKALSKLHPKLPQVACFDTSFHTSQPAVATAFALPRALSEKGVRRYGFHGLSYEYIAGILPEQLGAKADGKVVVAHLGHGASMCAMVERRSIATTMGFSALDGLVMGRRCGALDPGVILYLLDHEAMNSKQITHLLYEESGLFGVSSISDDMRELLASRDAHAAEAVELFIYRIVRELGSLAAALGGLDALVFTGGIGEHSPKIRARVCQQAAWLGVRLDERANGAGEPKIGTEDSAVDVLALTTNEEYVI